MQNDKEIHLYEKKTKTTITVCISYKSVLDEPKITESPVKKLIQYEELKAKVFIQNSTFKKY